MVRITRSSPVAAVDDTPTLRSRLLSRPACDSGSALAADVAAMIALLRVLGNGNPTAHYRVIQGMLVDFPTDSG